MNTILYNFCKSIYWINTHNTIMHIKLYCSVVHSVEARILVHFALFMYLILLVGF